MDYIQAKANEQVITAAVGVASGALKKDGMTADDWKTIQNSGIDWGNEEQEIISYNSFLLMSYDEQVAYLQSLEERCSQALENSIQTVIDANVKRIDEELIPAINTALNTVSNFEGKIDGMGSVGDFLMG
jgi:hypothetical protein